MVVAMSEGWISVRNTWALMAGSMAIVSLQLLMQSLMVEGLSCPYAAVSLMEARILECMGDISLA